MANNKEYYLGRIKIPYYDCTLPKGIEGREPNYAIGLFWFVSVEDYHRHESLHFFKLFHELQEWLARHVNDQVTIADDIYPEAFSIDDVPIPKDKIADVGVADRNPVHCSNSGGYVVQVTVVFREHRPKAIVRNTLERPMLISAECIVPEENPINSFPLTFIFRDHHDWGRHQMNNYEQLHWLFLDELEHCPIVNLPNSIECILYAFTLNVRGYVSYPPVERIPLTMKRGLMTGAPYFRTSISNKRTSDDDIQSSPSKQQQPLLTSSSYSHSSQ